MPHERLKDWAWRLLLLLLTALLLGGLVFLGLKLFHQLAAPPH